MFNKVSLTFFRRHEALTVDFTEGVNAIRAANECGKSTVFSAISYALFGARALNEPLADVVTYGHKESELKVTLEFTINNIRYTVKRGKSGAELTFAAQRVTGQTEVTKFVEELLGADADTASKLMVAKQSSVVGALAKGPSGAVELIETLANFELISEIVDLIIDKLPTGSTVALEQQITTLTEATEEVITNDIEAKQQAVHSVIRERGDAVFAMHELKQAVPDRAKLMQVENRVKEQIRRQEADKATVATLARSLGIALPADGDQAVIAALEAKVAAQAELAAALKCKARIEQLDVSGRIPVSPQVVEEESKTLQQEIDALNRAINDHKVTEARLTQMLIKDTTCGLCGKDLTDVPEVVRKNHEIGQKLDATAKARADLTSDLYTKVGKQKLYSTAYKQHSVAMLEYSRAAKYVTLTTEHTPAKWSWTGPINGDTADYSGQLAAERQKCLTYASAVGRRQQIEANLQAVQAELAAYPKDLQVQLERATAEVSKADTLNQQYMKALDDVRGLDAKVSAANAALEQEEAVFAEARKRIDRAKVQLAEAQAVLKAQNFNNALVKKLRSARPKIADKLWGIVLASVSTYFSTIRGVQSVVTKVDTGFKVNGYPVAGLSGSTLDALGLAIRIALTKTFLPNARFLILDEVASGMDATRESATLGMVASCGMSQVILVTHSELADSFASNVITL